MNCDHSDVKHDRFPFPLFIISNYVFSCNKHAPFCLENDFHMDKLLPKFFSSHFIINKVGDITGLAF